MSVDLHIHGKQKILINKEWLKCVVKQRFLDQFVQDCPTSLACSSKALNDRIFNTKFEFEVYMYFNILNIAAGIRLCRFRTTIHIPST